MIDFAQPATRRLQLPTRSRKPVTAPKLRTPKDGRREARETNLDVETMTAAAVIPQAFYFRKVRPALGAAALDAFRNRRPLTPLTVADGEALALMQARLRRLYAATIALGRARVRDEAKLPVKRDPQFSEILHGVPPKDAINHILSLNVVSRDEFARLTLDAQRQAFTASGAVRRDALDALRRLVARALERGWTERQFTDAARTLMDRFATSGIRFRTVWNTTVKSAMEEGRRRALQDPDVAAVLTHGLFDAMNDFATRPNHRALDSAVAPVEYWMANRIDLRPPIGFNCRCALIWITEARAQRMVEQGRAFDITQDFPVGARRDPNFN